jgi:hypothetical protein
MLMLGLFLFSHAFIYGVFGSIANDVALLWGGGVNLVVAFVIINI